MRDVTTIYRHLKLTCGKCAQSQKPYSGESNTKKIEVPKGSPTDFVLAVDVQVPVGVGGWRLSYFLAVISKAEGSALEFNACP